MQQSSTEFHRLANLHCISSGPLHFKTTLQPEKYGLKLETVLKWKDSYNEIVWMVSLIAGLKMEGIVKWRGL